ncbi:MAG TPA: TPM domain-containing protein [Burkholderiales bacterium]|jgi:uncharacterized membrane protein|nr:TPM domain-containing protein [Burkholderiales bacterium]
MNPGRLLRHLVTPDWAVNRVLPRPAMQRIEEAIEASERRHGGQVRVAVEAALDPWSVLRDLSARERAIDVFSALRVWDTEHNNGVLLYLLLADHDIEIVADRGIARKVPDTQWEAICREMESRLKNHDFEQAVITGIDAVSAHLARHFPPSGAPLNELPDSPVQIR